MSFSPDPVRRVYGMGELAPPAPKEEHAMRKIVAGLFMSLDGVVESPSSWARFDAEMQQVIAAGIARSDAILLGRRTYLEFAQLWPGQRSGPMAAFMNDAPKFVASRTLREPLEWKHATLIRGDLAAALGALQQQPGKNIQVPGSPTLVRALLQDGLLDELGVMIHPVVVGAGLRLFDGLAGPVSLTLADSASLSSGVVSLTYRRGQT
jgi:dihydrofolate reductase